MSCRVKESLKFPSKKKNEKQGEKKNQTTKPPNQNGQQKPAAKINCLGMCLAPFAYALQDVVSPSVYLLRVSPAAPRDEQGRGKNTSPDLGRHLYIPCKGLLGHTASLPSSPLQTQGANSDPKSSLCMLSPGTPSRGKKKAARSPSASIPKTFHYWA